MSRKTTLFAGALLALTPFALAQEQQGQATPRFPEDVLASQQLIAWSWMQKPQPAPQPLPPPDKAVPQPGQQTAPPSNPQAEPTKQTFTGKILKDGDRYVLKVSGNTTYQLDEQSSLKGYEDKDVRIVGTLDNATNTIRVVKIELFS